MAITGVKKVFPSIDHLCFQQKETVQVLFWRGTLAKSGFWCCHLGLWLDAWLVERWCSGGWGTRNNFPFPSSSLIFPLNTYSLGKYFLAPILHGYQIYDGGLITKGALYFPWWSTHRETNDKCIMPDIYASLIFMQCDSRCAGKATQIVNYFWAVL